ncbi:hypothetical protein AB0J90_30240 [Micromonospora sp. NPDC049523]|uniref:hypothetical protein n=1 Tax=Micromonospora sp. NPDC049523 TaxID=3155921 RepID=UPI00342B162A
MAVGRRTAWDPLAATAAALALLVTVLYLWLIGQQGGQAVAWFVGGTATAGLLAGYGVRRAAAHRVAALATAGTIMIVLGVLGILSIGLPILVAGALSLTAALRPPAKVNGPASST